MRYPFWNLCVFLCSTHDPYEILLRRIAEWNLLWDVIMCFFLPARLGSIPGYQFQTISRYHIWASQKWKHNLIRRSECTSLLGGIYIQQMPARVSFLAWQAHYDLKDPAGLAGFLIDSDIKLVRAEWGSPDESSRHKSQGDMKRNGLQNADKTKFPTIVDKGVFFLVCCFVFSHL